MKAEPAPQQQQPLSAPHFVSLMYLVNCAVFRFLFLCGIKVQIVCLLLTTVCSRKCADLFVQL